MRKKFKLQRPFMLIAAAAALTGLLGGCGTKEAPIYKASDYKASDVNQAQVKADNDFSMRLARPLLAAAAADHSNTVFSPFSVSLALSLVLNGAQGETKKELLTLLAMKGIEVEAINKGNEVLMNILQHDDRDVEVRIANAIWAQRGLTLQDPFVKEMKKTYAAPISAIDFADKPAAVKAINEWVNERTDGRIKGLVSEEAINVRTVMMLVNALYFHGAWTDPFEKSGTRDAPFHLDDGTDAKVSMMSKREELSHKSAPAYKAVQIPYGSGAWSMIAVLPAEGTTLQAAEAALLRDPAEWTEGFESGETALELPRFKIEAANSLTETLGALGMVRSQDENLADFSGISNVAKLFVSEVRHKAFIEVNEEGTEAAAATAVSMDDGGSESPSELFEFKADRPFLFAIRNATTGVIAFMGYVADPSEQPEE